MRPLDIHQRRELADSLIEPEGGRLIPLSAHQALELTLAAALLAASALLNLGAAPRVVILAAGLVMIGVSLGAAARPLTHARQDAAFLCALLVTGLVLLLAGEAAAVLVLAIAALAHGLLVTLTSYTRR